MELAKTCERSRQKPWPSPSAARAQHTRATCANETAEKWPENGPTDSPVVNPDCKRAFIIRRPGEGEGGGRKGSAQWRTSGTPRFCCFLVSRWQCHVANLHPTTRGGSPEFLPSLRTRFFFFSLFSFSFFFDMWQRGQKPERMIASRILLFGLFTRLVGRFDGFF